MSKSKIVTISDFYARKLNNHRDIYVYLPPNYNENTEKYYPVLYMHDGQNIFHPANGTNESWNVHKACDKLISENKMQEIIVVGIPNAGNERGSEYNHFEAPAIKDYVKNSNGLLYEDFLINDLKPHIDTRFRTLRDSLNTSLIGSSMGGLVTYHIGFRHPEVFGNLGIVSPFFLYMDKENLNLIPHYEKYEDKKPLKIWMDVGGYEGSIMVEHVRKVVDELVKVGYKPEDELMYYCDKDAAHTEKDWANRIYSILLYFFGNIGKPVSVTIEGRDTIGLTGMQIRIQPVIKYDSGFIISGIIGKYTVENPEIMEVESDGTIVPKSEGRTRVSFEFKGIKATKEYRIIKNLSPNVNVLINVTTPKDIDYEAIDIYGFKIRKTGEGFYSAKLNLPRDFAIKFRISRETGLGNNTFEVDKNGNAVERELKMSDDIVVDYKVEHWIDRL